MTINERRFYRIAVFLSILFHLAILFITIPFPDLRAQNNDLETISPDMLNMLPGSTNAQPALVESFQNWPDRPALPKPKEEQIVVRPQPQKQSHQSQTKPEVERKVEKPKEEPKKEPIKPKEEPKKEPIKPKEEPKKEPIKPKEEPKKEPIKPKEEPKKEPIKPKEEPKKEPIKPKEEPKKEPVKPKEEPKQEPEKEPVKPVAKPSAATKTAPGSKPDEVGKPPAARNLGSGDKMVSGGTNVPLWTPKDANNEDKEGNVKLRIFIDAAGGVESIKPLELSGDSRLDDGAIRYIQRYWKFKAIKERYYVDILISFKVDAQAVIQFLQSETRN
jgi:TonB family protein